MEHLCARILCYCEVTLTLGTLFETKRICFTFRSSSSTIYQLTKVVEQDACTLGFVFLETQLWFKHKSGTKNVVAAALSSKAYLLSILHTDITSFDSLPKLYTDDEDFDHICNNV